MFVEAIDVAIELIVDSNTVVIYYFILFTMVLYKYKVHVRFFFVMNLH